MLKILRSLGMGFQHTGRSGFPMEHSMFSGIKQHGKWIQLKRASSCVYKHTRSVKLLNSFEGFSSTLLKRAFLSLFCSCFCLTCTDARRPPCSSFLGWVSAQNRFLELLQCIIHWKLGWETTRILGVLSSGNGSVAAITAEEKNVNTELYSQFYLRLMILKCSLLLGVL